MRVDPLVPRAAKLEAIHGDKDRVNSASLDSPLVVLANQALKVLALDKRLHVCPGRRVPRNFSTSTPGHFQCWLRTVNELGVCDLSHVTCHKGNALGPTSAERMRLNRQRLRQGNHHITLLVNEDEIDFLLARGYPLKRTDPRSVAEAVSAYLSAVLEGA